MFVVVCLFIVDLLCFLGGGDLFLCACVCCCCLLFEGVFAYAVYYVLFLLFDVVLLC